MSFIIQAIFSGFLSLIILFIPEIYFSATLNSENKQEKENDNMSQKSISTRSKKRNSNNSTNLSNNLRRNDERKCSVYNDNSLIISKDNPSFFGNFCKIIKQKVFIFCALGLSNLFFIITAIQYWASDYEKDVLKIKDDNEVFLSFAIVCITSPTLGLFFGGVISAKTGGYESKNSIIICFVFALLAGISSIPVPLANNLYLFTFLLWLVLFFGGAILPNIMGIIMTCLPPHLRGSANSMTNLITNLFGYLPAPMAYGFIYNKYKDTHERLAMTAVIYSSFIGCLLLLIAMYFRNSQFKESENLLEKSSDDYKNISASEISMRKTSAVSRKSTYANNLATIFYPNPTVVMNEIDEENNQYNYSSDENDSDKEKNSNGNISNDESNLKSSKKSNKKLKNPLNKSNSYTSSNSNKNKKKNPMRNYNTFSRNSEYSNLNGSTMSNRSLKNYDINTLKGANPNFNYKKYLEENVFNKSNTLNDNDSENKDSNNSNEDDKKLGMLNKMEMENQNSNKNNLNLGLNFTKNNNNPSQIPLSIKTPDFNFVHSGNNSNNDLILNNNNNLENNFGLKKSKSSNFENNIYNNNEKLNLEENNYNKKNSNYGINNNNLEKITESKDERKVLSYDENYCTSEKSLFKPINSLNSRKKSNFSENENENQNNFDSSSSKKNLDKNAENEDDFVLSDNNDNNMEENKDQSDHDDGPSSYKKFNDYV